MKYYYKACCFPHRQIEEEKEVTEDYTNFFKMKVPQKRESNGGYASSDQLTAVKSFQVPKKSIKENNPIINHNDNDSHLER